MLVNVNLSQTNAKWVDSLVTIVGVCVVHVRNRPTIEHVSIIIDLCDETYEFLCTPISLIAVYCDFE